MGCSSIVLASVDTFLAGWFHARLTPMFAKLLLAMSEPGSGTCIGVALALVALVLARQGRWQAVALWVLTIPSGLLLGEALKLLVARQRPYLVGPFVDWSGYSFPSGHTIGATLLYGLIALNVARVLKRRRWRALSLFCAALIVAMVGFSRVALGAHYLSDVVCAMILGILWLAICIGTPSILCLCHSFVAQPPSAVLDRRSK